MNFVMTAAPGKTWSPVCRWVGMACLLVAALTAQPGAATDLADMLRLDIPAQPLERALTAYANATGLSALVDSGVTAGRWSTAVQGLFTPRDALSKLLAGTGLTVRYISNTAFTLTTDAPPGPAGALAGYAAFVQSAVTRSLCEAQGREFGSYPASLQLWIGQTGVVSRVSLLESTGQPERDAQLARLLPGLPLGAAPPEDLKQPITIRLTPRADAQAQCRAAGAAAR